MIVWVVWKNKRDLIAWIVTYSFKVMWKLSQIQREHGWRNA
jgi:hypothetical protein